MIGICSVRDKKALRLRLVVLAGPIERSDIPLHPEVYVRAALDKEPHEFDVASASGDVQSRPAAGHVVWVCTEPDQHASLSIISGPECL